MTRIKPGEEGRAMLDVTIVMFDDGLPSTAVMPIEIFHCAGRLWNKLHDMPEQAGFKVRSVSMDGAPVGCSYRLKLMPEGAIADVERTDIIIVPTSGLDLDLKLIENSALLPWLRQHHAAGAHLVGVCMGSAYLAAAGLLDGRMATTHWALADEMTARFPKARWHTELMLTEDNRVLCSGGVGSAIDISLYLVEKFCGHEIALQTAKALLLPMPRLQQSGYAVVPVSKAHDNARVREAEDYLQRNFCEDISTQALAARVCMTERTFARQFKAATGKLPAAYLQAVRIEAAKVMLESGTAPIQSIAYDVGYCDLAFFRELFKRATGMTPAQYRASFAPIRVPGQSVLDDDSVRVLAMA